MRATRPERVHVAEQQRLILGMRMGWMERAVRSNRILGYLAGMTLVMSLLAGIVMHLLDSETFSSIGIGLWWALQTFTTVGYGDVIPDTSWGKFVAGIVMIFGVTFLSIVTALVTSALITGEQRRRRAAEEAGHPPVHETLARIEQRLDRIEQRLLG